MDILEPAARRLAGRTAIVTGAARGIGRATALRLARDGANVVVTDLPSVGGPDSQSSSPAGLDVTRRLLVEAGASAVAVEADVRSQTDMDGAVATAMTQFGSVDVVVANAGLSTAYRAWEMTEDQWSQVIDVNLSGVWRTFKAAIPTIIEGGHGGVLVATGSTGSVRAFPNLTHYTAAKHGVLGLVKALASEVAPYFIRVNAVLPTVVDTEMSMSIENLRGHYPDIKATDRTAAAAAFSGVNLLPVPWVDPSDVANAIAWLCSDEARYITAVGLPVDAGSIEKHMP